MPGGGSIYKEIVDALRVNGEMDDATFRRLVMFALVDLGECSQDLPKIKKKVDRLERNSILIIAKKYPKSAVILTTIHVMLLIYMLIHLELLHWIGDLIGIPIP